MAISVFRSTSKPATKPQRHTIKWRNRKPAPSQTNTLHAIREILESSRNCRRSLVYETIKNRYGLDVEVRRIYSKGGVGSYSWLPRKNCIRLQVGCSKIDSRKHCFPYAPCVDIFDIWANL